MQLIENKFGITYSKLTYRYIKLTYKSLQQSVKREKILHHRRLNSIDPDEKKARTVLASKV